MKRIISIFFIVQNICIFSFAQNIDTCNNLKAFDGTWLNVNCTDTIEIYFKSMMNLDSLGNQKYFLYGWHRYSTKDSTIEQMLFQNKANDLINIKTASLILSGGYECGGKGTSGWIFNRANFKQDSITLLLHGLNKSGFNILVNKNNSNSQSFIYKIGGSFLKKTPFDFIILSKGKDNISEKIDLSDFNEYPLPDEDRANMANNTITDWSFENQNDKICVKCLDNRSYKNLRTERDSIRHLYISNKFLADHFRGSLDMEKGKLVTYAYYESPGGGLWYYEGNKNDYEIEGIYGIRKIFKFDNRIFCLTGKSNFGAKSGAISEIFKQKGKWTARLVIDNIDSDPHIVYERKNDILILTGSGVYSMDKHLQIKKIFNSPFDWRNLYPSSMFQDNKDLYIPMRKGILKMENFETFARPRWFLHQ